MKSSQLIKSILLSLLAALALQSCSIFELRPPEGFPEYQSKGAGYIPLQPDQIYEFHDTPQL